jgi:predicted TIM-barrel fold metal-dependent hydrolase
MERHITKIDFENHFFTRRCIEYLSSKMTAPNIVKGHQEGSFNVCFNKDVALFHQKELVDALLDIGSQRIAAMDKAGIDVHIISLTVPAGVDCCPADKAESSALAKDANDSLFEASKKYPSRLKGFAAISPYHVEEGIKELERTINNLGFIGWLTHSNFGENDYLDNKQYWPLLEAAESLNIPIYIHPTVPTMKEFGTYGFALAGAALGFQFDTALCVMRMILNGVFDEFPNLQIILGHLGETLPFLNERLDYMYRVPSLKPYRPAIKKIPSEVLHENIWITTSGRFYTPALNYATEVLGEERVLFATDYPMEGMEESVKFITQADLSDEMKEKIFFRNAERFVRI